MRSPIKHFFAALSVLGALAWSYLARAQATFTYPIFGGVTPTSPDTLIRWLYNGSLILAALAGFTAFVWGGVVYLTAAGNPSRAQEAKDRLLHALLGFLVVVFSGITLRFINPDFFKFNAPVFPTLSKVNVGGAPPAGAPGGDGYLSCQPQGGAGTFCTPVSQGSCGNDPQCAPCIGLGAGEACVQVSAPPTDFAYLACVPNLPCLTAQGGNCPSNFPCSDITGGLASNWQPVAAINCQDPERPVECIDGAPFNAAAHVCCRTQGPGAGTPATGNGNFTVTCLASPNPMTANSAEGVQFGITATNGTGTYLCEWSGSIQASGCNPEHVFPLAGAYAVTVQVTDLGTSKTASASCTANVASPEFTITNTRTQKTGMSGVPFCPDDPWKLSLNKSNAREDVWLKIWKDGTLRTDWISIASAMPGFAAGTLTDLTPFANYNPATITPKTDDSGSWSLSGAFTPFVIANWRVQARARGVETDPIDFAVKPCMRITNQTTNATQDSLEPDPAFAPLCVEDPWTLTVLGPPASDVWITRSFDGAVWQDWKNFSPPQTDAATGKWTLAGRFNRCNIGDWIEEARMTDSGGVNRLTDPLPFSVKSCLNVSCGDLAITQSTTPSFQMTGSVSGDVDRDPQTNPLSSYECEWLGSGGLTQNPPSVTLCASTNPVNSANVSVGSDLVTLRARTVVSDCAAQAVPQPQPADPQPWFDATCTLTVNP